MWIERVTPDSVERVLPLIGEYQRFYRSEPDDTRNRAHFSRILADRALAVQFVALDEDIGPVGFATLYFPLSSVTCGAFCLMNDLYVIPSGRASGTGRALIDRCRQHAAEAGYESLQWQTEQSNVGAQRLYDRMGAKQSGWYSYS
ncbi:MAG: GNAT family N-acetyltransferase, partial [Chloroflexota bacterium]|nr:GNAT family N-acetyltransferase [Chloroflexota bacterium]